MIEVIQSRTIRAPRDKVSDLVSDVSTVEKYNPLVKYADVLSPNKTGLGATRVCNFHDGTSVKERVIMESEVVIAFEISEYSFPVRDFGASMVVKALNPEETKLSIKLRFDPKYGPLGQLMGKYLMKPQVKRLMKDILVGVDQHLETGQMIGKNFKPRKE